MFGITAGADGNIWATAIGPNSVLRVDHTTGAISEFPLPTPAAVPVEITRGPDGNLWFSEYAVNSIARMTTGGVITEFPLPASLSTAENFGPRGIITGPDGNLWFLHPAGYVGKMAPSGQLLALYATPTPAHGGVIITKGPDGNLWFAEADANKIGRITPGGVITEFPVPTPNGTPVGIAAGRHGSLFFTERSANKIGRITTDGVISEFPIPTPNSFPQRIVALDDGSIWFVQGTGSAQTGQLARVLADGRAIMEYPLPPPSRPIALVQLGSNLWIADPGGADGGGAILRVTVRDTQ
jgi:streptogramin lyase